MYKTEIDEFKELIEEYIFHLLPIMGEGEIVQVTKTKFTKELIKTDKNHQHIIFYPDYEYNYYYKAPISSPIENFPVINTVYDELLFCINNYKLRFSEKHKNSYYRSTILEAALVFGICTFLTNDKEDSRTLIEIIRELKIWSQKTYEGQKVPFGFIIDFNAKKTTSKENYVNFLKNEHSAVFTDGVFSAVLLDSFGNIHEYVELSKHNTVKDIVPLAPTRFLNFANQCTKKKIGIVSLSNGNILLFREKQLIFAYTNGHWVAYDWAKYFRFSLYGYFNEQIYTTYGISKDDLILLSKTIYVSMLDVSLAHSGGCIAVIDFTKKKNKLNALLCNCLLETKFSQEFLNATGTKGEKLIEKNSVIKNFVGIKNPKSFQCLKNKLRAELMKLDGATILTPSGEIKASGAILSVKSGSEGGGRLSATKSLSGFGLAIKISEDGEISGYKNNRKIFHF